MALQEPPCPSPTPGHRRPAPGRGPRAPPQHRRSRHGAGRRASTAATVGVHDRPHRRRLPAAQRDPATGSRARSPRSAGVDDGRPRLHRHDRRRARRAAPASSHGDPRRHRRHPAPRHGHAEGRAIPFADPAVAAPGCCSIASGKGGVGKSSVTTNLAVALAQPGQVGRRSSTPTCGASRSRGCSASTGRPR